MKTNLLSCILILILNAAFASATELPSLLLLEV